MEAHVALARDSILGEAETDQLLAVPPGPPGSVTGSSIGGPDRDSIGSASDILKNSDTVDEEAKSSDDEEEEADSNSDDSSDEYDGESNHNEQQVAAIENNVVNTVRVTRVQVNAVTNDMNFVGHADGTYFFERD